jgi:hypothetical protein
MCAKFTQAIKMWSFFFIIIFYCSPTVKKNIILVGLCQELYISLFHNGSNCKGHSKNIFILLLNIFQLVKLLHHPQPYNF